MSVPTVSTRPASSFEPLLLLEAVRDVAEASGAVEPERISTREWDAARPLSERFADVPAAKRICEYLGLPWQKVRELAFKPGSARRVALGHALNDTEGNWLTEDYSDYVLTLIARRLGTRTLTPGQYRSESAVLLAGARGRSTSAGLRLPSEAQIAALAGSWDRALAHAELRPRQGTGGQRTRVEPVAIIDVLDRCYERHGTEPTVRESEVFARANGIPYPRRERGKPWSAYLTEWKDRRRAQGLSVPAGPPPTAQRPDYSVDVGAALPGERRTKETWDDYDEVVGWGVRYLKQLPAGQRSSQRGYNDWARGQAGAPWSAVFNRHGGWVAVRHEAWRRLRAS